MLHAMSSSKEKLSKLSKVVSNLDPKAVVKDSWHVQCSCGTAVKLNYCWTLKSVRDRCCTKQLTLKIVRDSLIFGDF